MTYQSSPVFCSIDTPDMDRAIDLVKTVSPITGNIKLGLEFFNANGPAGVKRVMEHGGDVPLFLDLKYHDIPNTVAAAIRAVTNVVKPAFLNVHASGGLDMMKAARDACPSETKLLAVTVLTSMDANNLYTVGQGDKPDEQVERLALLTKEAGLDGIVCSPLEIELVRKACGNDFILMVPGIRPQGADVGDQKRIMTPRQAMDAGADYLVIGRPITGNANPAEAAQNIIDSLNA